MKKRLSLPLRWLLPVDWSQRLLAAVFAGLALWLIWLLGDVLAGMPQQGHLLMGSIAASSFLVFVVPHSPMAKPWPLFGGHLVSALVGVLVASLVSDQPSAVGLGVAFAVLAMYQLRCLHPPGAATALAAVLAHKGLLPGYPFVAVPVLFNVLVLLPLALVYGRLMRLYEKRSSTAVSNDSVMQDSGAQPTGGAVLAEDIDAALNELHAVLDVSRDDLALIYRLAEQHALHRDVAGQRCADLMLSDLPQMEFGSELEEVWLALQQSGAPALPVVDRARRVIGLVSESEFLSHAAAMPHSSWQAKLHGLVKRTPGPNSEKPEVAGQIMRTDFVSVQLDESVMVLFGLARRAGGQPLVVLDAENRLAGLLPVERIIDAVYQARLHRTGEWGGMVFSHAA